MTIRIDDEERRSLLELLARPGRADPIARMARRRLIRAGLLADEPAPVRGPIAERPARTENPEPTAGNRSD